MKELLKRSFIIFMLITVLTLTGCTGGSKDDIMKNNNEDNDIKNVSYVANIYNAGETFLEVYSFEGYTGFMNLVLTDETEIEDKYKEKLTKGNQIKFETDGTMTRSMPPQANILKITDVVEGIYYTGIVQRVLENGNIIIKAASNAEENVKEYTLVINSKTVYETDSNVILELEDIIEFESDGSISFENTPILTAVRIIKIEKPVIE